jgi:hypothetical protein
VIVIDVIPHISVGIKASVVFARSFFASVTIPEVPMSVGYTQCLRAREEPISVSAAQMLNNIAKVF